MNTTLWILQVLLATVFVAAGAMKTTLPIEPLASKVGRWVDDVPLGAIRTVGALEILGAIGLILPTGFGIAPRLAGVAAIGLAVTMVGAVVIHARRGERVDAATNVLLGLFALAVAVGRL